MPLDRTKIKKSKGSFVPAMRYAWLTIKHKWFVLLAGLKVGCPLWRLITHDLSKFSRAELKHYGRQFFGDASKPYEFSVCWLHHQNLNDHHPEYWEARTTHDQHKGADKIIKMSDGAMLEMIADWVGASRAYEGRWPKPNDWWWVDNKLRAVRLCREDKLMVLTHLWTHSLISAEQSDQLYNDWIMGG